jgi:hypothetical protein
MGKPNFIFELGSEVKDKITGFQGILICRSEWLTGCNVYGIRSQELKDGKPMDTVHFDEDSIELLKTSKALAKDAKIATKKKKPGGPDRPVYQPNK